MTHRPSLAVEHETIPRLDRIEFVTVSLPFLHPFGTSVHVWTCKEALLLRLEADGVVAWGKCVADPDPFYLSETTTTARHIIEGFLLPLLEPGLPFGELLERFRAVRGHTMAKATIENAVVDLLALRKGVPVHEALGFPARRIMSGLSIGLKDSPAELVAAVQVAVDKRYHRVKMKVAKGRDVEYVPWEPDPAVRERADGESREEEKPLRQ